MEDREELLKRIYHPYWLWEDWKAGMWTPIHGEQKKEMLSKAIEFTGDAKLYGLWMMRAVNEWTFACEHNLTERSLNRLAWIGHAACCMAINCPEMITREAWRHLTDQQRIDADAEAEKALKFWIERHEEKNRAVGKEMGEKRIPGRNTGRSVPAS